MTGAARMVDVGSKPVVAREAVAAGRLRLSRGTLDAIRGRRVEKGDVLEIARVAAVQAAKATPQLLPLTHPIPLDAVETVLELTADHVEVRVTVRAHWRTGVEMEALMAAATALLTVWDLVKPLEKDPQGQYPGTRIEDLHVLRKVKG